MGLAVPVTHNDIDRHRTAVLQAIRINLDTSVTMNLRYFPEMLKHGTYRFKSIEASIQGTAQTICVHFRIR